VTTRKAKPERQEPEREAACIIPGCKRGPRGRHPRHPHDVVLDPASMTIRELEAAGITHLGGGWWQDSEGIWCDGPNPGPPPR
jgi:hypothetical protein